MKMRVSYLVLQISLAFLISGCSTEAQSEQISTPRQSNFKWSETALYRLKFSTTDAASWGLAKPKLDLVSTKSYANPNRAYIDEELKSVVPDYCTPVALIIEEGKVSGAEYEYFQSFENSDNGQRIQIEIKTYLDAKTAAMKFSEFLDLKDKCGAYIPTYSNGDNFNEVTRWERITDFGLDFLFFDSPNDYSEYIGLKGSAIFSFYVHGYEGKSLRQNIMKNGSRQVASLLAKVQGI